MNPFCQLCRWSRLAVQKSSASSCLFLPPCLPLVVKQPSLLKRESLSRRAEGRLVAKHILHGNSRVSHRGPAADRRPTLSLLYLACGWNSLWNISSFHQFCFTQYGFACATQPIQVHTNVRKCIYINAWGRSLNIQAWHLPTLKRTLQAQAPMNGWSQQSSMCDAQALEEYKNTERWWLTARLYGRGRPTCT